MKLRHSGRKNRWVIRVFWAAACMLSATWMVSAQEQTSDATAVVEAPAKDKRRATSDLLPTSTRFWVSVADLRRLETNIANTQIGKLSRQDTLAPFFASFEKQLKDSLTDNGIKFGLDVASIESLMPGEVAIAGVLPELAEGEKPAPGSHGVVVLIDVTPDIDAAQEFLKEAASRMEDRGAKLDTVEILEAEVSKWTVEVKAAKIKRTQSSFVTLVDGWLLASDNESIFGNVLRRIKSKDSKPSADSLSLYEPFTTIGEQTRVENVAPDLKWFVDPLGYARFLDALAEEKADMRTPKDRPLEALSREGLDALKAAGGFLSFSTGDHDVLHRTLVYADPNKANGLGQKRLFNLLDFAPAESSVAAPPSWVPHDAAGYFTITWDVKKAFDNVGPFVDSVMGEGNWDAVLDEMKKVPKFKVDIRKMVQSLGSRITVVATTEEPVNESSEKMLVGLKLLDGIDEQWLINSIGRAVKGKVKKLAGFTSVIDDRTEVESDDGVPEIDDILDELEDDEDEDEEAAEDEAKPAAPRVTIFNRRIMVIRDGYLFICNDKDYLKKIISRKPSSRFASAADFSRMNAALGKLSDASQVRVRMFNRLDQMLKTNYEMMRTGRMAESETFVARMLNQLYGKKAGGDEKRLQQIDGSDLPADYDKLIAPYLGQSGWVMETTDSGWRFSGCVLPKEKLKEDPAKKPADKSKGQVAEAPESSN